jgi:mono/diheme cytochrome c family protein
MVPAWDGGNAMMYVNNEQEIHEWILYGHPKRLEDQHKESLKDESKVDADHDHSESESTSLPISMPAFESVLSTKELNDLVEYYKAVAAFETPPPEARDGYRVASRLGCFGCHGPGGQVGSRNPGSFKGYIPPWQGEDFAELVKNDDELRDWILRGRIERFESNRLARYFTRRQIIQMPAYRDVLRDGDLEALVSYIDWLNRHP